MHGVLFSTKKPETGLAHDFQQQHLFIAIGTMGYWYCNLLMTRIEHVSHHRNVIMTRTLLCDWSCMDNLLMRIIHYLHLYLTIAIQS